jgi:hypothetical protein
VMLHKTKDGAPIMMIRKKDSKMPKIVWFGSSTKDFRVGSFEHLDQTYTIIAERRWRQAPQNTGRAERVPHVYCTIKSSSKEPSILLERDTIGGIVSGARSIVSKFVSGTP